MVKRGILLTFLGAVILLVAYPAMSEIMAPSNTVSGRVVNSSTGLGIEGADVRIQASLTEHATSAADGSFTIRTERPVGESIYVAAGALDSTGEVPQFYNTRLAVLVGDSGLTLQLAPSAMGDDPSYEFTNPQDCRLCHGALYDYWQDSPHRNAAKNTWVRDLYDGEGTAGSGSQGFVYKQVHPNLNGDCAECHAPMQSAKNPGDHTDFANVGDFAREFGVSCDVCHKTYGITNVDLPGVQGMQFARGARETIFGPLPDAAPNFPGVMRASYSALHNDSKLCAACHQDNNDHDLDLDYLDDGSVPSEETYKEWLASPYAAPGAGFKRCQDCHMQPKGDLAMCEQYQPVTRDPSQVYSHDFEGTTSEYLQNAATLRVIARRVASALDVSVAITNDRTGHDLPGGAALRHAILLVTATDGSGSSLTFQPTADSVVPEYGGVGNPQEGYFAGLPGKGFAKIYGDRNGQPGVFFTEAYSIASDNRIAAGETDWSAYRFQLPSNFVPVRVEAKLVYRRAFRDLVDLKGWALTGHGHPNPDLQAPDFGVVMGTAEDDQLTEGPAVDSDRVVNKKGLVIRTLAGAAIQFSAGASVEISTAVGEFESFSTPARVAANGGKLTQKGKIGGLKLNQFWPDGAERFVRVRNADGGASVLLLRRQGMRFVAVG